MSRCYINVFSNKKDELGNMACDWSFCEDKVTWFLSSEILWQKCAMQFHWFLCLNCDCISFGVKCHGMIAMKFEGIGARLYLARLIPTKDHLEQIMGGGGLWSWDGWEPVPVKQWKVAHLLDSRVQSEGDVLFIVSRAVWKYVDSFIVIVWGHSWWMSRYTLLGHRCIENVNQPRPPFQRSTSVFLLDWDVHCKLIKHNSKRYHHWTSCNLPVLNL